MGKIYFASIWEKTHHHGGRFPVVATDLDTSFLALYKADVTRTIREFSEVWSNRLYSSKFASFYKPWLTYWAKSDQDITLLYSETTVNLVLQAAEFVAQELQDSFGGIDQNNPNWDKRDRPGWDFEAVDSATYRQESLLSGFLAEQTAQFHSSVDEKLNSAVILWNVDLWAKDRGLQKKFLDALRGLRDAPAFANDLETFGVFDKEGGLNPRQGQIRLIQITLPDLATLVIDLGGANADRESAYKALAEIEIDGFNFWDIFKRQCESWEVETRGANYKFDEGFLRVHWGISPRNIADTQQLSISLWAGLPLKHGMGPLSKRALGITVDKSQQKSDWSLPRLSNRQINYGARDAVVTYLLVDRLRQLLDQSANLFPLQSQLFGSPLDAAIRESQVSSCFADMEQYGMPVDVAAVNSALTHYYQVAKEIITPWFDLFPQSNPKSSAQVLKTIKEFDWETYLTEHGLNVREVRPHKVVKGVEKLSTDTEALAPFTDILPIRALSLYRSVEVFIKYLENVRDQEINGTVRGNYFVMARKGTGRSSCGKDSRGDSDGSGLGINLQNPANPKNLAKDLRKYNLPSIRSVFKYTDKNLITNDGVRFGSQFLAMDGSQLHARYVGSHGDLLMMQIFREGEDVHIHTAAGLAAVNGKDPGQWHYKNMVVWYKEHDHEFHYEVASLRNKGKPAFYGSINLQGKYTLKGTVESTGGEISLEEAQDAIDAFRYSYCGTYSLQRWLMNLAGDTTIVISPELQKEFFGVSQNVKEWAVAYSLSGRRVFLEMRPDKYKNDKLAAKGTDIVSTAWLGTEACTMKWSMIEMQKLADQNPHWKFRFTNFPHDEENAGCFELFRESVATAFMNSVRKGMELYLRKWIPTESGNPDPSDCIVPSWLEKA